MNMLHRFDPDGRYLGWIAQDRPTEDYADRTDLTPDQPPDAPIGYHAFRINGAWVLQPDPLLVVSLERVKAERWHTMKLARRRATQTPLVTPYGTFDADEAGRTNIVQTAALMQTAAQSLAPGSQPTVDFTLFDNTVVTLTAAQMVEVALLLALQIQAAFTRGREVRAAIDAATTAEEVAAITWEPTP